MRMKISDIIEYKDMKIGDIIEYKGYVIIKKSKSNFYIIKNKEIIGYGNSVKSIKKMIDKIEIM